MESIYLDYNSTTPLAPVAQEAMIPYLAGRFASPHSDSTDGCAVNEAIEDARSQFARSINGQPEEIVWTSGATESNNLALRGLLEPSLQQGITPHLIISNLEHAAVDAPARHLATMGVELTIIQVNEQGIVEPSSVYDAIRPNTRLVSIGHANGELGIIQPIKTISEICRDAEVLLHSDMAVSMGKIPIDVQTLGVDLASFSGHKIYAAKGVGALYARSGTFLQPLLQGDQFENGWRAGMPNVLGIISMGASAKLAHTWIGESSNRLDGLRDRLFNQLQEEIPALVQLGGGETELLPNTLCVVFPLVSAERLLESIPELQAKACTSGNGKLLSISRPLKAIGADPQKVAGAISFALGWYTTEEEIDRTASLLLESWQQLTS